MLWQIIFLAAGILSLIYYGAICIALKKWDSTFSRFWLVCGSIGIAGSVLIRLYGMPCIVEAMIGISVCFLLITEIKIIKGMHRKPLGKRKEHFEEDTKTGSATRWIIVLGAQVRGRKITDSLKRRLDCASEYLKEHPDVHVIVSGGQGKDEEVTEAYAMARYLECEGLDRRRIVQEDVSVNTLENLKFSRNLIADVDTPVGIVSNNFHVYRGCVYAKRAGFKEPFPIPASCRPMLALNCRARATACSRSPVSKAAKPSTTPASRPCCVSWGRSSSSCGRKPVTACWKARTS